MRVMICVTLLLRNYLSRIESSNRKQYLQRHVALVGFYDSYPLQMVINPILDYLDVFLADEIGLLSTTRSAKPIWRNLSMFSGVPNRGTCRP